MSRGGYHPWLKLPQKRCGVFLKWRKCEHGSDGFKNKE